MAVASSTAALLGAAVLLFTFLPPTCLLFADLAAASR